MAGTLSTAGTAGTAGTLSTAGTAGTAGTGGANDGRCAPTIAIMGQNAMLTDTGPACFQVEQDIAGWGCSNATGRTVTVNGVLIPVCGGMLPPKVSGSYYFAISAGVTTNASFYWF
jgi:hypothetical protein